MSMNGLVACVTGATRGIGAATASRFVSEGATVFVAGRDTDACQRMAEALTMAGPGRALPVALDMADAPSISAAFRHIFGETKRLDVLVNNAGVMPQHVLGTLDADTIASTLAVNTTGAILAMQAALRLMQRHRAGAIVNVSSVLARHGVAGRTVYAASKAALEAATRSAAMEAAAWNVRVNAVAPGWIDTELVAGLSDADRAATRDRVPMGRPGRPEEVAALIAFLAGVDASYITGAIVPVDGGYVP